MSADILPIDDAGVDETEAIMRSDRARRTGGSFVITTVDEMLSWIGRIRADQATIATLTAERDTAAIDFANRRADTLGDRVVELIREIADARSALAAAEAERDAAVARAMPEARLMRTVEDVEALADGPILFRWSAAVVANSGTRVAVKSGRLILLDGYSQQLSWLTQAYVVALPDLPTPTAAQEGQGNG